MDDKKRQHSVSIRPSEWERLTRAAQVKARTEGPTSTGHVVSTSRFLVEAGLKEAEKVLCKDDRAVCPVCEGDPGMWEGCEACWGCQGNGQLPAQPKQAMLPMAFALKTDE